MACGRDTTLWNLPEQLGSVRGDQAPLPAAGSPPRQIPTVGRMLIVGLLVAASLVARPSGAFAEHTEVDPTGDVAGVGDPTVGVVDGVTYLYSTGAGIQIRSSTDLIDWTGRGRVFSAAVPGWASALVPTAGAVWAPDLSYWGGTWHLYYSVSAGSPPSTSPTARSVIGHATNPTLDPDDPSYAWTDHGLVVGSTGTDPITAIDPDVVTDEAGRPHLVWGSYRSGIVIQALDPGSGQLDPGSPRTVLAAREHPFQGLEAATMVRHGSWWYLFVSYDWCCAGAASSYHIRVGRSASLTGPFVDAHGRALLDDGGTVVLSGEGDRRGPGHQDVHRDAAGRWWLLHHWEATEHGPGRRLGIAPMTWDTDGWPVVDGFPPASAPPAAPDPGTCLPADRLLEYGLSLITTKANQDAVATPTPLPSPLGIGAPRTVTAGVPFDVEGSARIDLDAIADDLLTTRVRDLVEADYGPTIAASAWVELTLSDATLTVPLPAGTVATGVPSSSGLAGAAARWTTSGLEITFPALTADTRAPRPPADIDLRWALTADRSTTSPIHLPPGTLRMELDVTIGVDPGIPGGTMSGTLVGPWRCALDDVSTSSIQVDVPPTTTAPSAEPGPGTDAAAPPTSAATAASTEGPTSTTAVARPSTPRLSQLAVPARAVTAAPRLAG